MIVRGESVPSRGHSGGTRREEEPTVGRLRTHFSHVFDIRRGEGRIALGGFAVILLLVITAHTILETARDALLLTGPGPRALGVIYMTIALCALPAGALAGRLGERIGVARSLAITLALAAVAPLVLYASPMGRTTVMALYIASGVIASVVVPQFWMLVGTVLTVTQGRRLFGLISSAGVVGGVLGSGLAAAAIQKLPVKSLLCVSAVIFAVCSVLAAGHHTRQGSSHERTRRPSSVEASVRTIREQPFVARIALLVVLSTATVLTIDYFFKWSVARSIPTAQVGPFVARYYLALNVASLVVQLFLASAIVHRLGVAAAVVVTPLLLLSAMVAAVLGGGALLPILVVKGIDGSLRHSLHRITNELVYLPIPSLVRARAKPLIDGALARMTQTLAAASFLAIGGAAILSPRLFAAAVAALAACWLAAAVTMRTPYLALLRRALSSGSLSTQESPDPIDLETAELLVQHLASPDPLDVVGAMRALSRRGREGFVSALVLLNPDESVVTEALQIFGASSRTDWIPLGRQVLEDPREALRIAAARALAMQGELDAQHLASDPSPRVRGYGAVCVALRDSTEHVAQHPSVAPLLGRSGDAAEAARLGALAAIADAAPTGRLSSLLFALSVEVGESVDAVEALSRAAAKQNDPHLIPHLVGLLARRAGREAVRGALVALGDVAFDEVWKTLRDPASPRSLRLHLPKTLARFPTPRAAECLLTSIETEGDRLVRFKSIRALEAFVDQRPLKIDRVRVERLCQANVMDHFRILALRTALESPGSSEDSGPPAVQRPLFGLLDDKVRQSLDRAFRLLKIAHPRQEIRRAYLACLSDDPYARANAAEFLDTLLRRPRQETLRELLCLAADDLPRRERVSRATSLMSEHLPRTREEALVELVADGDLTVAALAALYASELKGEDIRAAVALVLRDRPEVAPGAADPFELAPVTREAADA
jgi:AAA family ATP:ADP antiporter